MGLEKYKHLTEKCKIKIRNPHPFPFLHPKSNTRSNFLSLKKKQLTHVSRLTKENIFFKKQTTF